VLFRHAVAPTPITLPSHATILTGLDPHEHGVRNNGTFVLDKAQRTLAEALREEGFATGATLGAFPVESRFGLDQGFSVYDDEFTLGRNAASVRLAQREAGEVTAKTLAWIGKNKGKPFFHWAHYFDPHFPYEPPPPYSKRFKNPYDGEIAKTDASIGELIKGLEKMKLLESTWILCVGDHGESLGEHGEPTHTMLIYGATQSVPCLLIPPKGWSGIPEGKIRGRIVQDVVRLKDLAPTIVHVLGLDGSKLAASGSSLLPLIEGSGKGPGPAYMETLVPSLEFGWSELRGVRTDRWCYIKAPEPELYDIAADPGEVNNVHDAHPGIVRKLSGLCDSFMENEIDLKTRTLDPDTVARLRNLGYSAAPVRRNSTSSGKDPKKLMSLFVKINDARTATESSRLKEARQLLESVLEEDPGNPLAVTLMGDTLLVLGDFPAAKKLFTGYLEEHPRDSAIRVKLAQALASSDDFAGALGMVEIALKDDPFCNEACELYPRLLLKLEREEEARAFLEEAIGKGPKSAESHVRFALFLMSRGETQRGSELLDKALKIDDKHARANGLKGEMLFSSALGEQKQGHRVEAERLLGSARSHFRAALASDPLESVAAYREASFLSSENRVDDAVRLCRNALVRQPDMVEAHVLATKLLTISKKYEEAIPHYHSALTLGFENPGFLLNYGSVLSATGRYEKAIEIWERGLRGNPPPDLAEKLRLSIERTANK